MATSTLAATSTWFTQGGTTVKRADITEIEIKSIYTPDSSVTIVSSWDASEDKDGSVMCYVIGTKLIIAGNGVVYANPNSYRCFSDADNVDNFENVTNIYGLNMLNGAKINNMSYMFRKCYKLSELDFNGFDTSNVQDMSCLMQFCTSMRVIDIHCLNTSNVTTMMGLFYGCNALEEVYMSGLNTSKLTNMYGMFQDCSKLKVADIANLDTSNVQFMNFLFYNCSSLETVDISSWDVKNLFETMECMFAGCSALKSLNLSNWKITNKMNNMRAMFGGCINLTSIGDVSNWDVSGVISFAQIFSECKKLKDVNVSQWNVSNCQYMNFMFYQCSSLGEIDVSNWDVSKVTNFDHFAAHANLKRKGIENWKTTSATNMNALFHNCAEEELDLSGWDVSKNQFFCQMFENSPNLKRIKGLENWDTSAGLGFDGMFERCDKLEEVDLSVFDTSKAKNNVKASENGHKTATLQNMFLSCNNLKRVTLGTNFSINGDGTNTTAANKLILPTPSADYIEGADGKWYTFTGQDYAPNAIPDLTYNTYYASEDLIRDLDVRVNNGTILDIVSAVREKVPDLEPTLLSNLDDVIKNI